MKIGMRSLPVLFFLFSITMNLQSQDNVLVQVKNEIPITLVKTTGFLSVFEFEGEASKSGSLKPSFVNALAVFPESQLEYGKFKSNRGAGVLFITIGSVGALIMGLTSFSSSMSDVSDLNAGSMPQDDSVAEMNRTLALGVGSLASLFVGMGFSFAGNTHLLKSVDLYNENIRGE